MNRKVILGLTALLLAALACSALSLDMNQVVGSGHVISESRRVANFTAVELLGSADVTVVPGSNQSVVVKADDNIVPLIETTVNNGTLVIRTKPSTSFRTPNRVQVIVTMNNPDHVTLSGSGNLSVSGVTGPVFAVDLAGSGEITVTGTADSVSINLPGSGNVHCDGLKARSAKVTLLGSGIVTVYASESLDASILGSGTIRYSGNPAQVTKNISGSGTITP